MRLSIHLSFNGTCEQAFQFYERELGGTIVVMLRHADSPAAESVPADWRMKINHATLVLGDHRLTGGDVPLESHQKPQGFAVLLHLETTAEAERAFGVLAAGGSVQFPLQETFWARRFGMLTDPFGIPWLIQCGKPA